MWNQKELQKYIWFLLLLLSLRIEAKKKIKKKSSLPLKIRQNLNKVYVHLLHDEAGTWEVEGQGAGILSFRSQRKLMPEVLSNVASEGKLGNRQPASV